MNIRAVTVFLLNCIDIHLEISRVIYEKNYVGNATVAFVGVGVSQCAEIGESYCGGDSISAKGGK